MHHFMQGFLQRFSGVIIRHPWRVILCSLIPCLFLAGFILVTPLQLSFMALVDRSEPLVNRYMVVSERVQLGSQLMLLLEGESESDLDETMVVLHEELEKMEEVSYVVSTPPTEWFEKNLAWITTEEDFETLLSLPNKVSDTTALKRLQERWQKQIDGSATSQKGARLVLVGLSSDPLSISMNDVLSGNSPYEIVERRTQEILQGQESKGDFTGFAAIGAQDQKRTLLSIRSLTPLSLLAVLLILRFVEPRFFRLVTIAFPMLLALVACLGLTGLLLGSLNFIEGFFGMMVFGLGVDFGLHLLVRMREEQSRTEDFETALTTTLSGAGPAIIAGAVTTAGAFAIIGLAPDPTAKHLGTSGSLGLLFCLILMLTLLPAVWVLMEKNRSQEKSTVLNIRGLSTLSESAARHPKRWLMGSALIALVSMLGMPRYHFETDLQKVFNRDVPAVAVSEKIKEIFGANTTPWVVSTTTLEQAQSAHRAFEESPEFSRVFGITSVFPVDLQQRHAHLRSRADIFAQQRKKLQILSVGPVYLSLPAQQILSIVRNFEEAIAQGPPKIHTLPAGLRNQLIGADGMFLTFAYGHQASLDAKQMKRERLAAEALHPSAAGMGNFIEVAMNGQRSWMLSVIMGIALFVALVLLVDLRRLRWIILALTPVTFGVVVTFGAMCWLNVGFSMLLLLSVPLLLGLGVDDGLHVVHRMIEEPDLPAHRATISVTRAITMTTLTTCASFGVLMFSNHPGMESMALTLLFGLPVCLFASATLVPALAVWMGLRRPPA
ncbi:MAG: MMPL family transporter [Myxococcota bacterium]|nr:MMPL family transporter [Myxococcota bacterium]